MGGRRGTGEGGVTRIDSKNNPPCPTSDPVPEMGIIILTGAVHHPKRLTYRSTLAEHAVA